MKLYTVGPTEMYKNTLKVKGEQVPYFRTEEFSKLNLENKEMMIQCFDAEPETEIVFLTASGSGAMEATVMNCFNEKDKVLVIVGGTFGERFAQICKTHEIPYEIVKLGEDEVLTAEKLEPYAGKGFTGLLVNLHETYTGQLYDIKLLDEFCQKNNMFLVVDAISTFLCDPYSMKEHHIDVTLVSSQKGLCLSPGISVIAISQRMVEKIQKNTVKSLYFNFQDYLVNMKRGQTPFTPAVGIHYELHDMLEKILSEGIDVHIAEVKKRAEYFRKKLQEMPIKVMLPPMPLSNAMTPIRFEKDIAKELFEFLKNEKDKMVNHPVVGELGKRSLRIAHIGDLQLKDYDDLLKDINEWVERKHYEKFQ